MDAKFFNRMPFPISMKKTWLEGAPALKLQPGETIEGPYELLSKYMFLAPMPFDFHKVESATQSNNFEYKDKKIETPTQPQIITKPMIFQEIHEKVEHVEAVYHKPPVPEKVIEKVDIDPSLLPFNPKDEGFSWMSVKMEQLKKAAEVLHIDVSHLENVPVKKMRWDLIKMIKQALGISAGN